MDAVTLDVPDEPPANREDSPRWAAMQLAKILQVEDGFDRTAIACAYLAAAQAVIGADQRLPFALVMEGAAQRLARQALHMEH